MEKYVHNVENPCAIHPFHIISNYGQRKRWYKKSVKEKTKNSKEMESACKNFIGFDAGDREGPINQTADEQSRGPL